MSFTDIFKNSFLEEFTTITVGTLLTALILADGLLIYMMAALLIHEVFGIVFVTVISVCIGYQLKGE